MARQSGRRPTRAPEPISGALLDGRYQLGRELRGNTPTSNPTQWAAHDQLLDRPVEVRAAPAGVASEELFESAPTDARWLRLLDVVEAGDRSWLVIEDPCRPTLAHRVADGRLDPYDVTDFGLTLARALSDLPPETRPARLGADQVYLDDNGIRLDGLGGVTSGLVGAVTETEAVRQVGALMFAALTARWPLRNACSLPSAPPNSSPRRIRGGIPRTLDSVVTAALNGQPTTLVNLIAVLQALPRTRETSRASRSRAGVTRWSWRILPPVALVAIGLLAWTIGKDLGKIPGADRSSPVTKTLKTPELSDQILVWSTPPKTTVIGGTPDMGYPKHATDDNAFTTWAVTETSDGLVLDLGRTALVTAVKLALTRAGGTIQIRAAGRPPQSVTDLKVIATQQIKHDQMTLTLPTNVHARYWVIRFSKLPEHLDTKPDAIATLGLLGPDGR